MRLIKGQHHGRTITLSAAVLKSDNPQDITYVNAIALLDTGASSCGLSPDIIKKLDLKSIGKDPLIVATEVRLVDYYIFRIGLFEDKHLTFDNNIIPYVFAETKGFAISKKDNFDMVLGMDVLSQCDFEMYRNGSWTLTFG